MISTLAKRWEWYPKMRTHISGTNSRAAYVTQQSKRDGAMHFVARTRSVSPLGASKKKRMYPLSNPRHATLIMTADVVLKRFMKPKTSRGNVRVVIIVAKNAMPAFTIATNEYFVIFATIFGD